MRPRWSRTTKIMVVVVILMLAAYLLYRFSVVIPPLTIAVLLAYIISPLAGFVAGRFRLPRSLAVVIIYLGLIALLIAAPLLFIPELIRQLAALSSELETLVGAVRRLSQTVVIFGGHVRLHPLLVILGIVVGAVLAGMLGIALAAPVIATLRILARYVYAGLFDLDPFDRLAPLRDGQPPASSAAVSSHD